MIGGISRQSLTVYILFFAFLKKSKNKYLVLGGFSRQGLIYTTLEQRNNLLKFKIYNYP